MNRKTSSLILKAFGWTVDGGLPPEDKCIILGAPHTTIFDFPLAYLYYKSLGGKAVCMVKKETFRTPLGPIVRKMGGIPVDRSSSANMLRSIITEINANEKFHLAIAPEGTRRPVKKWKMGFRLIAKACDIPVYLVYFDWGRKHIGWWKKFELTDDAEADRIRLQQDYEDMHITGLHNENYRTR